MKKRLCPYRSPSLPAIKMNVPTVSEYAAGIQDSWPGEVMLKLSPIMCKGAIAWPRAACVISCAMQRTPTKAISRGRDCGPSILLCTGYSDVDLGFSRLVDSISFSSGD